jgi:phosphoribosylformylglycinamidine synthase
LAAFREGVISAAHDISDGGTLVALAKMAFATHEGPRIGIAMTAGARDAIACDDAFAEASGFLIEVAAADEERFAMLAFARDVVVERIGTTTGEYAFQFADGSSASLDALHEIWSAPLRDFYAAVR